MVAAEVLLLHGEMNALAKIIRQSVYHNGKVIVSFNGNLLLNTLIYECKFPDGTIKEYAANITAKNIFNECNPYGHQDRNMLKLVNHKRSVDTL